MSGTHPMPAADAAATAWQPRIIAFVCNWCTYTGMDLAGTTRLKYAPGVQVIRIPCSGRLSPHFILRAFEKGADAVWISGCHPGDCHYAEGNYHARRKLSVFKELTDFIGIDPRRLKFTWISAAEGKKWAESVSAYVAEIQALGPMMGYPAAEPAQEGL